MKEFQNPCFQDTCLMQQVTAYTVQMCTYRTSSLQRLIYGYSCTAVSYRIFHVAFLLG